MIANEGFCGSCLDRARFQKSPLKAAGARRGPRRQRSDLHKLVSGLSLSSHATSWVLHIALTTRDQVDMCVFDGLPSSLAAVHADVEAAHPECLFSGSRPYSVQQMVDRAPLRLK